MTVDPSVVGRDPKPGPLIRIHRLEVRRRDTQERAAANLSDIEYKCLMPTHNPSEDSDPFPFLERLHRLDFDRLKK